MAQRVRNDKINGIKLAYLYVRDGQWDKAVEEYLKLLEKEPEDMNIRRMLGDVHVKNKQSAKAYEEYDRVARHFLSRGQTEELGRIREKMAALDPKGLTPKALKKQACFQLFQKAEKALAAGDQTNAVNFYQELEKLEPEDKDLLEKIKKFEPSPELAEKITDEAFQAGESCLKSHFFKKAIEAFKRSLVLDPQRSEAHFKLAQAYEKSGLDNDAKKEYLIAANQVLEQGELDLAFDYAGKAVELKSIEAQYVLGVVFFQKGQWADARVRLESLLRIKTNHLGARIYLAKIYHRLGQESKAEEVFRGLLKSDPNDQPLLEAWATFCAETKKTDEAVEILSQLIEKAETAKDLKKAIVLARRSVIFDPKRIPSKIKLAHLLELSGDKPGAADIYYHLGSMQEAQNKHEEAAGYFRKTVELNPVDAKMMGVPQEEAPEASPPENSIFLTYDHLMENNTSPAQEDPLRIEEAPQPAVGITPAEAFQAQLAIGDQYMKEKLLDEAIAVYQELLEIEPGHKQVIHHLNQAYSEFAKTGTDLTRIFEPTSPVQEKVKKAHLDKARKNFEQLLVQARGEAGRKLEKAIERTDRLRDRQRYRAAAEKEFDALAEACKAEAEAKITWALSGKVAPEPQRGRLMLLTIEKQESDPVRSEVPSTASSAPVILPSVTEAVPVLQTPLRPVAAPKRKSKISFI